VQSCGENLPGEIPLGSEKGLGSWEIAEDERWQPDRQSLQISFHKYPIGLILCARYTAFGGDKNISSSHPLIYRYSPLKS
jgi:hypothetical protein